MSYREETGNWVEFVFRLALLVPVVALAVFAFWVIECRPKLERDAETPAVNTPHTGRKPWVTITVGRGTP